MQMLPPQPVELQHMDGPSVLVSQAPGPHQQHLALPPGLAPHLDRHPMHPQGLDAARHLQPNMYPGTSVAMNVPRPEFIGMGQRPHLQQQQAPLMLPGLQGLNIPGGLGQVIAGINPGQFLGPRVMHGVPQPGQMMYPEAPHLMHADNSRGKFLIVEVGGKGM